MNRRGFLRAVGAAGLWLTLHEPAAAAVMTQGEKLRRDRIAAAIRGRQVLRFRYHGFVREAEPHALGQVTGGRVALLAWQTEGGSHSEPPPGWRTFLVAEISQVRVLKRKFAVRPGFQRDGAALKSIDLEVTP